MIAQLSEARGIAAMSEAKDLTQGVRNLLTAAATALRGPNIPPDAWWEPVASAAVKTIKARPRSLRRSGLKYAAEPVLFASRPIGNRSTGSVLGFASLSPHASEQIL